MEAGFQSGGMAINAVAVPIEELTESFSVAFEAVLPEDGIVLSLRPHTY